MKADLIKISDLTEKELLKLSNKMTLSLNLAEMKEIQVYFRKLKREPTDAELETLAQTWSEHCKHKVFNSLIDYSENGIEQRIDSIFNSYIRGATEKISKKTNWLVSVFKDNAGIISMDDDYDIAFKVETHNHPSALDPYGGANTGIGGVIRDVLGCGLGAKPFANTDVFCFAEPDTSAKDVPEGILHPKRIAKGVRAGVRDYGNRMGIPTVNGAIFFDSRYLGNPLVYCGTVGVMPKGLSEKQANPGDWIVAIGGKTGRDGIHGATFSSAELTEDTDVAAVQIGNPIEEKKVLDVILMARDKKLYSGITDCGAGGFSSAVGETAEETGAKVFLEKVPLKYKGLKPWEIWVSESQERMVLSVPPKNIDEFLELCEKEDVEAFILGEYTNDKRLQVFHEKDLVLDLDMEFLHNGLPRLKLKAEWNKLKISETEKINEPKNYDKLLKKLLAMPNIASKESTVRLYDHEVQGGSLVKPFVGKNSGPSDAAVVKPVLGAKKSVVISNAINPWLGESDAYWMAASEIDEAIRNIVCSGGNPDKIALLDNFCWGNPNDSKKLGELVRTAKGCHDFAVAFGTPFISGKDSFYNEFSVKNETIAIPSTLLISAVGFLDDDLHKTTTDFKKSGNPIYLVGKTFFELNGSHYAKLAGKKGWVEPKVNATQALDSYRALHTSVDKGLIESMHDLSDGGLGVAVAEMCIGGMLGCEIDLRKVPLGELIPRSDFVLFSESNSRILVEVKKGKEKQFEKIMGKNHFEKIGLVKKNKKLIIKGLNGKKIINENVVELKKAWSKTLRW